MNHESIIIDILKTHEMSYIIIDNHDSLVKIYNLFNHNIIFDPITRCELLYLGTYHNTITKNYSEMKKYYKMAIDKGDDNAMNRLGCYYSGILQNHDKKEKYLLMAIEKENILAMYNLSEYHRTITKNYIEMEKYYLMAIEKGDQDAMFLLACYHETKKNYTQMEKYLLMAIEKGDTDAMNKLAAYHQTITKNYIEMEKYYLMAFEKGDDEAINNISNYYKYNNMKLTLLQFYVNNPKIIKRELIIEQFNKLSSVILDPIDKEIFLQLLMDFEFKSEDKLNVLLELLLNNLSYDTSIMNLHFTYTVNGKGFEDAKRDYFDKCVGK